jgi:hypothetical protein
MCTLDDIVTEVGQDCAEEYRRRMRARLMQQPRAWLVDQLLDYVADIPMAGEDHTTCDRPGHAEGEEARAARIRAMKLDERCLQSFAQRCSRLDRDRLEADGYLVAPPPKGTAIIDGSHRARKGNALLREAKDLLHALLFGDRDAGVQLDRVQRELLTITVPRAKAAPIACLLRAATVIEAEGTWRDPTRTSDDDARHNTLIEVEYGEVATETVGHGIVLALRLINDLEINEQILYARIENVEESTLA